MKKESEDVELSLDDIIDESGEYYSWWDNFWFSVMWGFHGEDSED